MIEVTVQPTSGVSRSADFLIDTGADRSAFSADFQSLLQLPTTPPPPGYLLSGIGGQSDFVLVSAVLELKRQDGGTATVQGQFAAFTDTAATDFCVLGRDVLDNFDVIVSRKRNQVLLLAGNHQYQTVGP
jgi:hypothetical protein